MTTLQTTLDDPPSDHNDFERKMLAQVEKFGWTSTHVFSDENGQPSFTYSTGFWLMQGQPEVILFDMPSTLAHDVLGAIFDKQSDGLFFETEKPVTGVLSDEEVYLLPVRKTAVSEYLLSTEWFYKGSHFPCSHMIWPDRSGRFPWQSNFEAKLLPLQPDISKNGWPRP